MSRRHAAGAAFCVALFAASAARAAAVDPPAATTATLADTFFDEGDYFRAITEYRRELHGEADAARRARAWLRVGVSYARARRYGDAARILAAVHGDRDSGAAGAHACYQLLLTWIDGGLGHLAKRQATVCGANAKTMAAIGADRLALAAAAGLFEQRAYDGAEQALAGFEARFPASKHVGVVAALRADIAAGRSLTPYSPLAAGVMSAVIPGLGQLYQGRSWDGVQAFALVGVLGLATAALVRNEWDHPRPNWLLPIATGSVAAMLYGANVYGAANGARMESLLQQVRAIEAARKRWRPALDVPLP